MFHNHLSATLNIYYALPPTSDILQLTNLQNMTGWDTDNMEKLMATWPHTTSLILGKTTHLGRHTKYHYLHFEKKIIEDQVDQMLQDKIIKPFCPPCSSPMVLVPKPNSSYHFCVDCRKHNSKIKPDA